jgi:SAM-dependent methyltransferase
MSFYTRFADHYEAVFPFRQEVYAFLGSYLPPSATRVLDVGCGTGHYCGRFAEAGLQAVGIDLNEEMISSARRHYPQAVFTRMDMRDVQTLGGVFDLAFCIGNVAAHVGGDDLRRMILGVRGLLQPEGIWVLQVVNWDHILQHRTYAFRPKTLDSGRLRFLREYQDISEHGVRFVTRLIAEERTLYSGDVKLHPLRAVECELLHADCGFKLRGHFADFGGTPFSPTAESGSVFVFASPSHKVPEV